MTAVLEGIKTFPPIPQNGEAFISVNLAKVSLSELIAIATELGFTPELVQMTYTNGSTELHALLWHGKTENASIDLEERWEELAIRVDSSAVRFARARLEAA